MPFLQERRLEVLAAAAAGETTRQIATGFKCSESWVRRVKQEYRELGKTAPLKTRNRISGWHSLKDKIIELTEKYPDQTLSELKTRLNTHLTRTISCVALKALKLSFKKNNSRQRTRSRRCSREASLVAITTGGPGCQQTGFYRRNMGKNQHDQISRSLPERHSTGCQSSTR